MYRVNSLRSGVNALIVVRSSTEQRLSTTCFRGKNLARSGNFFRWNSVHELFRDPIVREDFLDEIYQRWSSRDFGTHSVSIQHRAFVGWDSTDPIENYTDDELEIFQLNRKSHALRVKLDRTGLFAPKTKEITLVYEFKDENGPAAIVHSIYPGIDIGQLDGDITQREGRVFFDWSHPGEV